MKKLLLLFALLLSLGAKAQIIFCDYSDPDVCEGTNGDFWLTASSFQTCPGLPILHSTDCIHWECVNYALDHLIPREKYDTVQHGAGVWAPSIRLHNGTYYIYWGDPDYGVFMVKTTDPCGKWDEPVLVVPGKGIIDTTPLWDDDGRCYLVNGWAASRAGFNSVLTIRELSADGTHAISTPRMVYDGIPEGNHTIEGPKLYKHDGYYYILAPAGGVGSGWELALRSKSVYGPYESKIVFNKDGIHQGGWVKDKFLCFQEVGAYGRILHLLDVEWKGGWPMMSQSKYDHEHHSAHEGYAWHSNYQEHYGFHTPAGTRIYSEYVNNTDSVNMWKVSNLYLKKFDGETFRDTLFLTLATKGDGQQNGFIIMGRDYLRLAAISEGDKVILKQIICKDADKNGKESIKTLTTLPTKLTKAGARNIRQIQISVIIECRKGAICQVSYSTDFRHFTPLPDLFQAREGRWIGAKYGVFSLSPRGLERGWVDMKNP